MAEESVKVAVRVRPFNQREQDRQAKIVIQMQGNNTAITHPENHTDVKTFAFDFSYWSHDGFEEQPDGFLVPQAGSNYASQKRVFDDLGQGVLDNAFLGYNCSLFAYGQTGAGKSYSMVGYGNNRGIVPITCDELFKTIAVNSNDATKRFEVTFSMLEIYNENVHDLLGDASAKSGLPVRQHPSQGFYVHGLKRVPVGSYREIEQRMEQGTSNRTVAATNMNATSSRAHTVVTIVFDQIVKSASGETKKSSVMNLVDLAGSERADSTGATGDRLKEGANINKSLSALGNVISALADQSMGKKKVVVPYRDSVLTKLLQNALGGNSKTVMIAALSPADINYDETLGTLRYADRAKKIKNQAVVNENPMDKLLRELQSENERLKKALESGDLSSIGFQSQAQQPGLSSADLEKMKKELEEEIRAQLLSNSEMMQQQSDASIWEAKLAEARADLNSVRDQVDKKSHTPHLLNLNEDPILSGVVVHYLESPETLVGRSDEEQQPQIRLMGLSVSKRHAIFSRLLDTEFEIRPAIQGAKTRVNGLPLTGPLELTHKDRIVFGSNHVYVFMNPKNQNCNPDLPRRIDWDFVQKEIASVKGFATGSAGLTKEQAIVQEQILELIPMVTEVNAISEELNKYCSFEVILLPIAKPDGGKASKCIVQMRHLLSDLEWRWERGKFMNRRFLMLEMYQRYQSGDASVSSVTKDADPFWEPPEEVAIGTATLFLQSLAYCLDFEDRLPVVDHRGAVEGYVTAGLAPCDAEGRPLGEDEFVEEPEELLGRQLRFCVRIQSAELMRQRHSRSCRVAFSLLGRSVSTTTVPDTQTPRFNFAERFSLVKVQPQHLQLLGHGQVSLEVLCQQREVQLDPRLAGLTTRQLRERVRGGDGDAQLGRRDAAGGPAGAGAGGLGVPDASELSRARGELVAMQHRISRLEARERRLSQICAEWAARESEDFHGLFRAISALANATGGRFRANAGLVGKMMQLRKASEQPNGGVGPSAVDPQPPEHQSLKSQRQEQPETPAAPAPVATAPQPVDDSLGKRSKTCTVM